MKNILIGLALCLTFVACTQYVPEGDCEKPPQVRDGMSLLHCSEQKETKMVGCLYLGVIDGDLCAMAATAPVCTDDWALEAKTCGMKLLAPVLNSIPKAEAEGAGGASGDTEGSLR